MTIRDDASIENDDAFDDGDDDGSLDLVAERLSAKLAKRSAELGQIANEQPQGTKPKVAPKPPRDEDPDDLPSDDQEDEEDLDLSDEDEEQEADSEKQPDRPPRKVAEDDAEVEFTVDGETKTVKVKDLKRLAGQEASLTRKSQEASERLKASDELYSRYETAMRVALDAAAQRFKPYAEADWLVLSRELSDEDFKAMRETAKEYANEFYTLKDGLEDVLKDRHEFTAKELKKGVEQRDKLLADPEQPYHIKGWGPEKAKELKAYVTKVDEKLAPLFDTETNPAVMNLVYKAMKYDQAKSKASQAVKTVTQSTPKAAQRPGTARVERDADGRFTSEAATKARQTGSIDDVAAMIAAKWEARKR